MLPQSEKSLPTLDSPNPGKFRPLAGRSPKRSVLRLSAEGRAVRGRAVMGVGQGRGYQGRDRYETGRQETVHANSAAEASQASENRWLSFMGTAAIQDCSHAERKVQRAAASRCSKSSSWAEDSRSESASRSG